MARTAARAPTETLNRMRSGERVEEPTHLLRFKKPILSKEYWHTTQYFLHGGWPSVIRRYFYESPERSSGDKYSPILIFPGDELSAPRIEPIPEKYEPNLTIGKMIIKTAWMRGLSARLFYLHPADLTRREVFVKFIQRKEQLPVITQGPPSIESLEKTLLDQSTLLKVSTKEENSGRGKKLENFIETLTTKTQESTKPEDPTGKFSHFSISIKEELKSQFLNIDFQTRSLIEILNAISYCLDATWEWVDEKKIYILPAQGYGTSVYSCIGEGC